MTGMTDDALMTPQEIDAAMVGLRPLTGSNEMDEGVRAIMSLRVERNTLAAEVLALRQDRDAANQVAEMAVAENGRLVIERDALRETIARQLEEEADSLACQEDANVTRSNAILIRANFSYEDAERLHDLADASYRADAVTIAALRAQMAAAETTLDEAIAHARALVRAGDGLAAELAAFREAAQ